MKRTTAETSSIFQSTPFMHMKRALQWSYSLWNFLEAFAIRSLLFPVISFACIRQYNFCIDQSAPCIRESMSPQNTLRMNFSFGTWWEQSQNIRNETKATHGQCRGGWQPYGHVPLNFFCSDLANVSWLPLEHLKFLHDLTFLDWLVFYHTLILSSIYTDAV